MRWKWIAGTALFLIVALMAAIYMFLSTFDYNKLKPRIARMVKNATDRELNIDGEIDLVIGLSPALVVTDITFANASWGSQPHMIRMDKVQAQVRLLPLLTREVDLKKIAFTGVAVLLETKPDGQGNWQFPADESSTKSAGAFQAAKINADHIRLENFELTYRDDKTGAATRFSLTDLNVAKQTAGDRLAVDLRAVYNGQPLTLAGQTGLVHELLGSQRFSLELSGSFAEAAIKLVGAVDDVLKLKGIDLNVQTSGKNLANLKLAKAIKLPKTTAFDLTGYLRGSKDAFALNHLSGTLAASNVNLAFSGNVGDLMALEGIDLQLKGSGKNLAAIGTIINRKLPAIDVFEVQGRLTGSTKALSLQAAHGSAKRGSLNIDLSGEVKDLIAFRGFDLLLKGSGKNLAEVGPMIGKKLPATNEFAIDGRLTGSAEALSLKNAQATARHGRLHLALNGGVKNLLTLGGLDLQSKLTGGDLTEFGEIIGAKLPATDQFEIQGRLTSSVKTLSLKEAGGRAKSGSVSLVIKGEIMDLLDLGGMDLHFQGTGKDLAKLGPVTGKKLPATDAFSVQGRLRGSTKALSLLEAEGRARRDGLNLTFNGKIKELLALEGINVNLKASGKDLSEVGPIIGKKLKLPTTDNFTVQGRLKGSTKALSLQEAMGRARRDGMSVAVDGEIMDVLALRSINISLKASGKELATIGPLVGANLPKIGPFDVRGHLTGSAKLLLLNKLSAIVDKSDFKGLAKIEFRKRPKVSVRLESSVIDFTPFMRMAEKDKQEFGEEEKRERRLFPEDPLPFDVLKKVDADILMKARNIHAKDARLEFGHLILKLQAGDFSIDRLEATYKQTKISGNLYINSSSPPQVATNFIVQGFDLGDLLKETGVSDQVRANVDIAAHLKSRGDSVHSLMANLDGSIGAVMGEGYLTRYLDMLSVNLTQKVIHFWGRHKKGGEIRCAVVQFDINSGTAISKAFVVDTEAGLLTGEGDINLGTEQLNFLLVPKPKGLGLSFSTKLRVSGSVMDPKVRPDTLSLLSKGARALSALVIGPLGLLAPFVHLGAYKAHPCDIHNVGK